MKGIVLAGGRGSRLYPVTMGISKHLIPVYDKPLIFYPLSVLMLAGIQDILLITTAEDLPNFQRLLGTGANLGITLSYAVQKEPRGVADAILVGEQFIDGSPFCLILGDNIFYGQGFTPVLRRQAERVDGACVFAYPVQDPQRFGVIELDAERRPIAIHEKPAKPKSNLAISGLYFYDSQAPAIAKKLRPSGRGELEITSVNQAYLDRRQLDVVLLGRGFAWLDTGTYESLVEAGVYIHAIERRQGFKVACLEEIALRNGWIGRKEVEQRAEAMRDTPYGGYLGAIARDGVPAQFQALSTRNER